MHPLPWAGLVLAAVCAGASVAGLLVVRRTFEAMMAVCGMASIGALTYAFYLIIAADGRPVVFLAGTGIAAAGFAGGFGLVSAVLETARTTRKRANPALTFQPSDADSTAVFLLADIENPTYGPGDVTAEISDLVDAGVSEPSIGSTPFVYAAQKARYRAVGDLSPEYDQARALCEKITPLLDHNRFDSCHLVRCRDGRALTDAVGAAVDSGYRNVVVATAHVAESFRIDREKSGVDPISGTGGVWITYTQPLWASVPLAKLTVARILSVISSRSDAGVALVMSGQPGERERTYAAFDVQENAFVNRVKLLLTEAEVPAANIRTCWHDWRTPDVSETVRHLAALGCSRIVVCPACFPFENLATLLDFPVAIRQARVPGEVSVVQVAPWRDDDVFAEEIAAAVHATHQR
ncbi:MAG: ferrochelatase [Clostridiales bacterium]|nr:ferrochelatase [Clostridiales bacterium]